MNCLKCEIVSGFQKNQLKISVSRYGKLVWIVWKIFMNLAHANLVLQDKDIL